jgi:hypothetical protein
MKYVGGQIEDYFEGEIQNYYDSINPRYFFALKRTIEGELTLVLLDQTIKSDEIVVNDPGPSDEDYPSFRFGEDFFYGRDPNHEFVYDNLKYEQYKWDNRYLQYYIDADGEWVQRINQIYIYPE